MEEFEKYLNKVGEIGEVEQVVHSVVYVSGLPKAKLQEKVIFENGEVGQVISISKEFIEVLLLTTSSVKVGYKLTRTDGMLQVSLGNSILGRVIDPLGVPIDRSSDIKYTTSVPVDTQPHGIVGRREIEKPLETGVSIVDVVVPLAKGQRELVIGDRKTGKTEFLLQALVSQARKGTVCIYAVIGQRVIDIKKRAEFLKDKKVFDKTVVIAASSVDPAGLIFLTPYTAMAAAEFFRDQGLDVLLILDDMTTHARCYREISLLAKRFPGRNSYPGDIFYIHARLIERAGNFKKGSITCLPVAESVLGDLSGYIQTNLMAMTDGHVFFDIEYYNQGKRPAVSPFLSVTRVGHQAQTSLQKDISRQILGFLVKYEKMKQFMHFGAEAGENVKKILTLGKKIDLLFTQSSEDLVPINASILILTGLFAGFWNEIEEAKIPSQYESIILSYATNEEYRKRVDSLISSSQNFKGLVDAIRIDSKILNEVVS